MNAATTDDLDITSLRYKIYVRKSSEDSEKQVRSLDDQEKECLELAERLSLKVIGKPVRETKSAKAPNNRPQFTQLLKEVKTGVIDGIIAWHPDRLARNAVESGKIIYLLDTGTLQDLRFVSHQFSNDANGKMLLGMLFVFAKHYSDDLSSKVKRGVRHSFAEGKSGGVPKHGYKRDDEGIYRKDDKNFEFIANAWEMRANGEKLPIISKYLNGVGYSKYYKRDKAYRIMKMTPSVLSKMFNDPFYYGVLVQAEQVADLRNLPVSFEPMIDEDTFHKVQEISRYQKRGEQKESKFLPFRGLLHCTVCDDKRPMSVYRAKSSGGKYYVYFKCRNNGCSRKPRDIRARVVADSMNDVLEQVTKRLTKDVYKKYLQETKELSDTEKKATRAAIVRNNITLKHLQDTRRDQTSALGRLSDPAAIKQTELDISSTLRRITEVENDSSNLEKRLRQSEVRVINPQEFNDLVNTLAIRFKKANLVQKDIILRNLFSNIGFSKEKVESYTLQEPFYTLLLASNDSTISLGGGAEIRTPAPGLPRLMI